VILLVRDLLALKFWSLEVHRRRNENFRLFANFPSLAMSSFDCSVVDAFPRAALLSGSQERFTVSQLSFHLLWSVIPAQAVFVELNKVVREMWHCGYRCRVIQPYK